MCMPFCSQRNGGRGGGGLRAAVVRNSRQFSAIYRNFPQLSRKFSDHLTYLLVPLAVNGEPYECAHLRRPMRLNVVYP